MLILPFILLVLNIVDAEWSFMNTVNLLNPSIILKFEIGLKGIKLEKIVESEPNFNILHFRKI